MNDRLMVKEQATSNLGAKIAEEFLQSVVNAVNLVVNQMNTKQYPGPAPFRELRRENVELRALFQAVTGTQEREREAIAQDLHDGTGQNLASALVNLEMALDEGGSSQDARDYIESASSSIDSVLKHLLDLSTSLHPPVLDGLGLQEALRNLVRRMSACNHIDFRLITNGDEGDLPGEVKISLYRIVQEALSNIIKHPGVKEAIVTFNRNEDGIDLMITGDASGFDGYTRHDEKIHLGLVNVRERAEQTGGTFDGQCSDQGISIKVHVPTKG